MKCLSSHLASKHKLNNKDRKKYYLDYIKPDESPICIMCNKNERTFINIIKGFKNIVCTKCSRKNSQELYIIKYGEEEGKKRYQQFLDKSRQGLDDFIKRFGKEEGTKKFNDMNEKRKLSNSKKGLIKKHGEEKAEEICKSFGLTKEELIKKHGEEKAAEISKQRGKLLNIEYWINEGYTEEEAYDIIKERQSTFSLEKCIKKHGEEKGYEIWKDRQDRWQKTLNSKPLEERIRITKAKMGSNTFSKVSQEMFWMIYEKIKNDFNRIYFATYNWKDDISDWSKNYEYFFIRSDNKICFFDFYIKDVKKVIEFDGDYWHGEERGNKKRDRERDKRILEADQEIKILRVKERDYRDNPIRCIRKCLEFIYG